MICIPDEEGKIKTVKEFDEDDKPRERALKYGIGSLSNADLLALILRTGTPGNPITEICRDLMRANGNKLKNLERASATHVVSGKGLGPVKIQQIEAIMEIVRRYGRERMGDRVQIVSAHTIYDIMCPEIANLDHEEIWVLFLNRANYVIGKMMVTQGSSTASVFDIKKIVKEALMVGAEGVVMCHNHPSGSLRPSVPDDNITKNLASGCKLMDIRVLDHVIVTNDGYYSYHEEGRIL